MLRKLPVGQLRANETLARLQQAMVADFDRRFGGLLAPKGTRQLVDQPGMIKYRACGCCAGPCARC
jgi:hypothetical protein